MAEELTALIRQYLENDVEKLLRLLYRIDIPESDVNRLFSDSSVEDLPLALTEVIIKRQLAKAKTREQYRNDPVMLTSSIREKHPINENP